MQANGGRTWSGPLIDAHAHVGQSLFGLGQSVPALLASMAEHGIARSVLVPLKPPGYHLGPENDRVAQAVADHPDRFSGFARVDPWQGEAARDELRRSLDELSLAGLFLHPFEEQFAANDERRSARAGGPCCWPGATRASPTLPRSATSPAGSRR
jgi:predicted TIM-barrel fold metal-dependent hydrolase